jgi:glycosyltransferase involved in cell wall biosynthesis
MNFAVLTTTYKRPELLLRAIESVRKQACTYRYIIVNDSPEYDYTTTEKEIRKDNKITYIKNSENRGKNYSLNSAIDILKKENFTGYVVFLDDDDWLADDCLEVFANRIKKDSSTKWLVSNRTYTDDTKITQNKKNSEYVSYTWDYLLLRRFRGDATHCIDIDIIEPQSYPTTIPNAEEWIFFAKVNKKTKGFLYIDTTGTWSDGYLNDGLSSNAKRVPLLKTLHEIFLQKIISPSTLLYFLLRTLKRII